MKAEVSASVCRSCEATRMSVEKGVPLAVPAAVASKAGLQGPVGTGKEAMTAETVAGIGLPAQACLSQCVPDVLSVKTLRLVTITAR